MLGHIDAIEMAFPPDVHTLETVAQEVGLSRLDTRMFDRFYGLRRFHGGNGTLDELLTPVITQLQASRPQAFAAISHVAHCHTVPDVRAFDQRALTPNWLQRFAPQVEFASLTMGHCATPLTAAEWLLKQLSPEGYGLLLIGEKAFHPRVKLIRDTTLMGEAACAVLLSRQGDGPAILSRHTGQDGRFSIQKGYDERETTEFGEHYIDFTRRHLLAALDKANLTLGQIDWIAPHNVNLSSWHRLAQLLDFPREKIFLDNIPHYGHCFGADPFINLHFLMRQQRVRPGDKVMLVSVGLGATYASLIVEIPTARHTQSRPATSGNPST
ncbi:3-oxoacyl-[acyl-carrier-protein] synthase III C-terminal domain-containing protein [Musicola paradisiaca]|uniref:3-Oxoacyl-(Acyl-carrier-protein (ACP)) synthase III domain protein n=2 Tax=Musicola paradisiaca TaxID=69223 RepID=C6C6K4_MUSP7|nr:3-oxoacyl-[acyl-carrier-protein] synthase III C-terminal domain-containing protein [Musicola paradisiaca]ACS83923.1 3-Oxoacyl-(acyl-carrier-protein (ACP)) synthase III domain protein [Musicola paradisiaca Ech703]